MIPPPPFEALRRVTSCLVAAGLVLTSSSLLALNITGYSPAVNDRFSDVSNQLLPVTNTSPSFIGLGYDWTGIGLANTEFDAGRAYFTGQHYIYAKHAGGFNGLWTVGVNDPNALLIYDGRAHEETPYGYSADLAVGTSANPPPSSRGVARYAILDYNSSSTSDSPGNFSGIQVFLTGGLPGSANQSTRVASTTISGAYVSGTFTYFTTPGSPALFEGGDSGQPGFHGWTNPNGDKELALLGNAYGVGGSNYLHFLGNKGVIDQLNVLANDDGYAARCVGKYVYYSGGYQYENITWLGNGAVGFESDLNQTANWSLNTYADQYVLFDAGNSAPRTTTVPAAMNLRGLYFKSTAATGDGFTLGGGGTLTIGRGGITNYDDDTQTISAPLLLGNPQYWSIDRGTLEVSTINNNGCLLEKGGAGTVTVSGAISGAGGLSVSRGLLQLDAINSYTGTTWANNGVLRVNGSIASSPSLMTRGTGIVGGSGIIGALTGSGWVEPGGAVPGILTSPSVYLTDRISFGFRLNQSGSPNYANTFASGNDVLRFTGVTPFTGWGGGTPNLSALNTVNLYFSTLPLNSVYRGGFFTDKNSPYSFTDANYKFYVADPLGPVSHNGVSYSEYSGSLTLQLEVVAETANFSSGSVPGYIMQLRALSEPAPGSTALFVRPITSTGVLRNTSGTWVLKGASGTAFNISGLELSGGGGFVEDDSVVSVPHRLNDAATLSISGGTFELRGIAGGTTTQSFSSLTIAEGATTVKLTPGASGTASLQFGSLTRLPGGTANYTATTGLGVTNTIKFTTAPSLVNGLLPYARFNTTNLASYDITNGVIAATYQATTIAGSTLPTDNVKTAANETLLVDQTVNTLVSGAPSGYGNGTNLGGKTLTVAGGTVLLASDQNQISNGTLAFGSAEGHIFGASRNFLSSLTITGTGGVTYGGDLSLGWMASNYTGPTRVEGAITIALGAYNIFSDSSPLIICGGATLGADGRQNGSETFGSLAGSGTINIVPNTGNNINLIFGGDNTSTTYSGPMNGRTNYTKNGTGTLTYTGTGTNTGNMTINGGALIVNGSLAATPATIANTATLGGNGSIGAVTIQTGGRLAPGSNSAGTLQTGAQTWAGGSIYNWEINSLTGTKGGASGWDWLNIAGAWDLSATTSNFVLNADAIGALPGWNKHASYTWTIASASGGITGFQAAKFTINTGAFSDENPLDSGTFSGAVSGNDLNLTFTPFHTPIQAWRADNSLPIDGTGTGADNYDASGNGMPNLLKYALGQPANSTSLAGLPVVTSENGRLALRFQRDPMLVDISYIVEASSDLNGAWTPIASSVAGGDMTNLGGAFSVGETGTSLRAVTVLDLSTLGTTPKRFLRLKIVRP